MISDQYEPTDSMFTVASRLKEEVTVNIEQLRDRMVCDIFLTPPNYSLPDSSTQIGKILQREFLPTY